MLNEKDSIFIMCEHKLITKPFAQIMYFIVKAYYDNFVLSVFMKYKNNTIYKRIHDKK